MGSADVPLNQSQADYWNRIAPDWDGASELIEEVAGPFGRLALEALRLRVGERVLDVGCGAGVSTRMLADAVHPSGSAVGVDISTTMIGLAQQRVFHGGASFQIADIQTEPVDGAPFDAAYSRFGVMFFADPTAAFANIRRLLHPGGRLAFTCWQSVLANEWILLPALAVKDVTGTPPQAPGPDEPGPFSFADAERIESVLSDAGFSLVRVEPVERLIELPADQLDPLVEHSRGVGPLREALRDASPDLDARLTRAVRAAFETHVVALEDDDVADDDEEAEEGTAAPPRRVLRLSSGAYIVTARA